MEGETDRTVIGDLMLEIRLLLPLLHLTCPLFVWLACQVSILGPHVRFHSCFQKKKSRCNDNRTVWKSVMCLLRCLQREHVVIL